MLFQSARLDADEVENLQHLSYMQQYQQLYVGRKQLLKQCQILASQLGGGQLVAVVGKPGCGKTALMVRFIQIYLYVNMCDNHASYGNIF
jgi:ABC-type taurine transport system ATPase subunit